VQGAPLPRSSSLIASTTSTFGEWQKGRATLRAELAPLHAGPLKNSQKKFVIEKVRFLGPDVAVAQVSSLHERRAASLFAGEMTPGFAAPLQVVDALRH
jgi:hypothetical protein